MITLKETPPCENESLATGVPSSALSAAGRRRIASHWGEPLFLADWMRVLMIHFEVDAAALQPDVPFELDQHEGRAFVTLVAFTMENMRLCGGGKLGAWLLKPIATHDFLNVRTYVRHHGEPGIHFIAEWLSSWLAVQLGPRTFGLPYHHGRIHYDHKCRRGQLGGTVTDVGPPIRLAYHGTSTPHTPGKPCAVGSRDEWLMERYTAFNAARGRKVFFRVWHPPWPQIPAHVEVEDASLLEANWPWFQDAKLVGANYSPGVQQVWIGRPHCA